KDLGPMFKEAASRGMLMHTSFALLPSGLPLGVTNIDFHCRRQVNAKKNIYNHSIPITEKESYKWLSSIENCQGLYSAATTVVHVCDREADIFELFAKIETQKQHFLIRARFDRQCLHDTSVYSQLAKSPVLGKLQCTIPSNGTRAKRIATVELRSTEVMLRPPNIRKSGRVFDLSP